MAFSEIEAALIETMMESYINSRRPPTHLRKKVDLAFRLRDQSVEIFEIRPSFFEPSTTVENFVAKATFVKRTREWRIYWMPSDLTWQRYEPTPEVASIEEFIQTTEDDEHACFWG